MARDAASLSEIVRASPYEGAPALWPLLLRIPARGGLPYESMLWLNWGFMGAAAAVLLRCAPLPLLFKIVFLSSYAMQYEYAVKARNYSVSIFLTLSAIALYAARRKHPWMLGSALFLLANSTVWGAAFAVPLLALLVGEQVRTGWQSRPARIPIAFAALGLATLVAQLVAPGEGNSSLQQGLEAGWHPLDIFPNASYAFFMANYVLPFQVLSVIAVVFLGIVLVGLLRRPRALFFFGGCTALLMVVYSRMGSSPRHGGFLVLAVAAALWLASLEADGRVAGGQDRKLAGLCALSAAMLAMSIPGAVRGRAMDWSLPFSGSRQMAAFLLSNNLLQVPTAAHRPDNAASVLPYLPRGTRFYYPALEEFRAYAGQERPVSRQDRTTFPMAAERSFLRFDGSRFLLLFNQGADLAAYGRNCRLLYHTAPAMIRDEDYWLYDCNS